MNPIQQRVQCGDKEILLETGKIAKQADGAAWVQMGGSIVLVAVVSTQDKREGIDFFPLTVDYQEKMFASGRVPGNYFRREGRATEKETLTSRIVDRSWMTAPKSPLPSGRWPIAWAVSSGTPT